MHVTAASVSFTRTRLGSGASLSKGAAGCGSWGMARSEAARFGVAFFFNSSLTSSSTTSTAPGAASTLMRRAAAATWHVLMSANTRYALMHAERACCNGMHVLSLTIGVLQWRDRH